MKHENRIHGQERRKLVEADPELIQISYLSERGFKVTDKNIKGYVIKMENLNELIKHIQQRDRSLKQNKIGMLKKK